MVKKNNYDDIDVLQGCDARPAIMPVLPDTMTCYAIPGLPGIAAFADLIPVDIAGLRS